MERTSSPVVLGCHQQEQGRQPLPAWGKRGGKERWVVGGKGGLGGGDGEGLGLR